MIFISYPLIIDFAIINLFPVILLVPTNLVFSYYNIRKEFHLRTSV